jgi:hypothetical protein
MQTKGRRPIIGITLRTRTPLAQSLPGPHILLVSGLSTMIIISTYDLCWHVGVTAASDHDQ